MLDIEISLYLRIPANPAFGYVQPIVAGVIRAYPNNR